MEYINEKKGIRIIANSIEIGHNVQFGNNIDVQIRGNFKIGDYSRLGNNAVIKGNNITLGNYLYNSSGLRIGGGGRQYPNANFKIGDRCGLQNAFFNICEPIEIGDDVGFSEETTVLTHGYWLSVLDGNPAIFKGVKIGNKVSVGFRSVILMGVNIVDNVVIAAQSTVFKSIKNSGVYAGNPARFLIDINPIENIEDRIKTIERIIENYMPIAHYHGITPLIRVEYPNILIRDFGFNVETFEYWGEEDEETDDLRDFIRKYGIRIYTKRPFKSKF